MNKTLRIRSNLISFGIPLFIVVLMVLLAQSTWFESYPRALSFGITFDLLLTVPLTYFLLIRKKGIPKITVVTCFILGVVIASLILPKENQLLLDQAKTWLLPVAELSVVAVLVYKVRKVIRHYRENKGLTLDFFTGLKEASRSILPDRAAMALATEVAIFYYGFFYWKKRTLRPREFTYHKNSGTLALLITILFIVAAETFIVHLLLVGWSVTIAWILTILSLYSAIQVFGLLKSMIKRPISIVGDTLNLRYGIFGEATVNVEEIISIETTTGPVEFDKDTKTLSPLGDMESYNTIIRLKKEGIISGFYGIKRRCRNIVFYVDKPEEFKMQLENGALRK